MDSIEPYTESSFRKNIQLKTENDLGYIIALIFKPALVGNTSMIRDGVTTRKWIADFQEDLRAHALISDIFWYILYGENLNQVLFLGNEANSFGFINAEIRTLFFEANQGNCEAQFRLGFFYLQNTSMSSNFQLAKRYLNLAVMQKHPVALYVLGTQALNNYRFAIPEQQALALIHASAELDYPDAIYFIGRLYAKGSFLACDHRLAFNYYKKAAALQHAKATALLGDCFAKGVGTPLDWFQASLCYKRSLELGCLDARYKYAMIFQGRGTTVPFCFDLMIKHLFIGMTLDHQPSKEKFLLYFPNETPPAEVLPYGEAPTDHQEVVSVASGQQANAFQDTQSSDGRSSPLKSEEELFKQRQKLPSPSGRTTAFPISTLINMPDEQILTHLVLRIWNQEGYFLTDGIELKFSQNHFSGSRVWNFPQAMQIPLSISLLHFAVRIGDPYAKSLLDAAINSHFFDFLKFDFTLKS